MLVELKTKREINNCGECPFCRTYEDTSVCFDSFDEPNFEVFCAYTENDEKKPKEYHIDTLFSRFDKCEIPKWCPLKNKEIKK